MPEVVCLGILVADVVAKPVERMPGRGQLQPVERMELHLGGCAANTAVALAKLGIPTAVVGKVGQDGFGDYLEAGLRVQGLDTRGVVRESSANSSATMVMVHADGERSFLHYIGVNATLRERDIDFSLLSSARILSVGGCFLMPGFDGQPLAGVLRRVKQETGVTVCLDTAWDASGRWMEILAPCLPYVDCFLPSLDEARLLSGREAPEEIASVFFGYGVGTVAIKMGEAGSYVQERGQAGIYVPALRVPVVDALGAGDCFVAGFVAGLVQGWDLERAARLANATGACCVTALGATTGVRTLEETLRYAESLLA